MQVDIFLPLKTVSEANLSEHWTKRSKRSKMQQNYVRASLMQESDLISLPCKVTLIRFGIKEMDYDNLVHSFKHVRDGIASYIHPGLAPGQADNDPNITWVYQQSKCKKDRCGVAIKID